MSELKYLVEKYRPQMEYATYGGRLLRHMKAEELAAVLLQTLDAAEAFKRRMYQEELNVLESAEGGR